MSDNLEQTSENKPERDEKGRLLPGNSGNPNGRPKGSFSLVEMIRHKLEEVDPLDNDKRTYAQILVAKIIEQGAKSTDTTSQKLIMNYLEGLPKATLNIGGDKDSLEALTEFFRGMAKPKTDE
jgi:hypothetical protein